MNRFVGVLAVLLLGGCSNDWSAGLAERPATADSAGRAPVTGTAAFPMPGLAAPEERVARSFANAPDRGSLVQYPHNPVVRRSGAYTWHAAELSEEHALRSMATGGDLSFTAPDGTQIQLSYQRHVEHPDGNWSWIGRGSEDHGESTVITFGESAVFGTIPQGGHKPELRLTMAEGRAWVVSADPRLLRDIRNEATHPTRQDFLIPGKLATAVGAVELDATSSDSDSEVVQASATADGTTIVDVLVGFTDGYSDYRGGNSAAITRIHNLIDVANQAYVNSKVAVQARLVHSMEVNYPDATDNGTALEELTGFKAPSTRTTPAAAFSALRSARDGFGADLVVLLRRFQEPENGGCGIAWLIGGGQTGIDSTDQFFGYSVVSDGQDAGTDGKTYFCRDETLAHELGHNMGSQHDTANAKKDDGSVSYGAFAYSFGLNTAEGGGNFYTVMAYGDSGQTRYRAFSNPDITICGGFACGVKDKADNARSLRQTAPTVAAFRATVVPTSFQVAALDLAAIFRVGSQGTELNGLSRVTKHSGKSGPHISGLGSTGSGKGWEFLLGDYNLDGIRDLYVIKKAGGSGRTEVHVLDGANEFKTFLLHKATALHQTGTDGRWTFGLADYNRDGRLDLYCIDRRGKSNTTEVHVLSGAATFNSFLTHRASALGVTGTSSAWKFLFGDYNRDGTPDVYVIKKAGTAGKTEAHVLNGADGFKTFLLHRATALGSTGTDNRWDFKIGDYDSDGVLDIYAINKVGASGTTELHVLSGKSSFTSFSAHLATGLQQTGSDNSWEFDIGR